VRGAEEVNRPTPSLDAVLSAMLIAFFVGYFALAVAAWFVTWFAVGKFVALPVLSMLVGVAL
jgi:hypothetical protein